jgi:hypothetical protein
MNAPERHPAGFAQAIERIAAMPAFLEAALHEAGEENLALRPTAEAFSLREHACHLRDLEREGYLVRIRRILNEQAPSLASFDGQAVAESRDYPSQDAHVAAQEFATARRELLALLAPLSAEAFRREGTFEGKRITLADLVAMVDAHDGEHRIEIEGILDAIED